MVGVLVAVGVAVGVCVGVAVGVLVAVGVAVGVLVAVGVAVGVAVRVGVGVLVGTAGSYWRTSTKWIHSLPSLTPSLLRESMAKSVLPGKPSAKRASSTRKVTLRNWLLFCLVSAVLVVPLMRAYFGPVVDSYYKRH